MFSMFSLTKHLTHNHLITTLTLIPQVLSEPNYKKHHLMLSKPIKLKHLPFHKIILFYPSKKNQTYFQSWHRWHSLRYFFLSKNKIRNSIKEQSTANQLAESVAITASV